MNRVLRAGATGLVAVVALACGASLGAEAASGVRLGVSLANPVVLAGARQRSYLKVSLTGYAPNLVAQRPPVNVAIVLDRSGSMQGDKLAQAREAALVALDMLDERDILSVVTYDDTVSVLVPATRLSDTRRIAALIRRIEPGGMTALFAGVSKGASEVRKFIRDERVNRVILLSDGLANVGPASPGALGDLGASLRKEGISVTTIGLGLGYNEDLMVRLAGASDGNHSFVESSEDLVRIFAAEFRDILNVVARDVEIEITCRGGVTPLGVLGREADIVGQSVLLDLSQIYGNQEKYVLLEVELPAGAPGQTLPVADVEVRYGDLVSRSAALVNGGASVAYSDSARTVEERADKAALVDVVRQVAAETTEQAVQLRDAGKLSEAKDLFEKNAEYLEASAEYLDAPALEEAGAAASRAAGNLDDESWNAERKKTRSEQYATQNQQSY
jgi:Ca-activated chloride channel family protein